jgi:acetyl esterase/lipase
MRRLVTALVAPWLLAAALVPAQAQFISFRQVLERPERPQPQGRVAYGALPQQQAELWLPPASSGPGPHPVVLMVHGGCWRADLPGPELLAWQAEALRQRGVAVYSVTYRRLPGTAPAADAPTDPSQGGYPATFQDLAQAADHLRTLAAQHPLDLQRVTATGHSAGGHLALWLAARKNLPASSPLHRAQPLPIHAVVPVAGVGDLAWGAPYVGGACGTDTIPRLVNAAQRGTAAWADTSPAAMLPLGVPVLMVSGLYDPIVAPAHARRYQRLAADKADTPVRLMTLDEASHFELVAPWTDAGRAVVDRIAEIAKKPAAAPAQ